MPAHIEGVHHGLTYVHAEKHPSYQRIDPVPVVFSASESTEAITFIVEGSRELSVKRYHYILNGMSTFTLNACIAIGAKSGDRETFIPTGDFYAYHQATTDEVLNSQRLIRALNAFDGLSREVFGRPNRFIERTGRGSGSHPSYRLHPDVVLKDLR